MKKVITLTLLVALIVSMLTGCGLFSGVSKEEKMFREKIDAFIAATQSKNSQAIKLMFSPNALKDDGSIDNDLTSLYKYFPKGEVEVLFDGMLSGRYSQADGKRSSSVDAVFPIKSEGEYFWIFMDLTYEDDFDADNIGLNRIYFYCANDYYLSRSINATFPTHEGLMVNYSEASPKYCCVNNCPATIIGNDTTISLDDAKAFLSENKNIDDFTERFGNPYASISYNYSYYYRLEGDELRYLEIHFDGSTIVGVSVVNENTHLDVVFDETAK